MDDDALARRAATPLRTRWLARPLRYVSETGSTNDDVRSEAARGAPHGFAVVADAQSAGRGRRGRVWHSPRGESVYFSLLLRPALLAQDRVGLLALAAGLAVAEAVGRWVPRATVKWPNDVRIDGRKVAGVLVEGVARVHGPAHYVVGIGLNVNGGDFPVEIAQTATSLRRVLGAPLDRGAVLTELCACLERRLDAVLQGDEGALAALIDSLRARCDTLGTRVRIEGVVGLAVDLEPDGALRVARDDGSVERVRSGEVIAANA